MLKYSSSYSSLDTIWLKVGMLSNLGRQQWEINNQILALKRNHRRSDHVLHIQSIFYD